MHEHQVCEIPRSVFVDIILEKLALLHEIQYLNVSISTTTALVLQIKMAAGCHFCISCMQMAVFLVFKL